MSDEMRDRVKALTELASKATPGTWTATQQDGGKWTVRAVYTLNDMRHTRWPAICPMATDAEHDARYIAAASPEAITSILSLITAELERVERERDEARAKLADADEYREALYDFLSLQNEAEAIRGGGPGWSDRWNAAWDRTRELFAP